MSTNRNTIATGLYYEETEVVAEDAAAGWSALCLIDDAEDDGVGR